MHDNDIINDLADLLRDEASKSNGRGLRISLHWLVKVMGGDGRLARNVLRCAGFAPDPITWSVGGGAAELGNFSYPPVLANNLKEIRGAIPPIQSHLA